VGDVKCNGEAKMLINQQFAALREKWKPLTIYQKFEQTIILILSTLIAVVVALAVWTLVLKFVSSIVSTGLDPTDYTVFQTLFGLTFTVIIALEFKRSPFVVADQQRGTVRVRTVILIALLTIVRKLMIIDLTTTDAQHLFALATAILALGGVYWLVRDQDRRERA
jgi:uncharacterized membrane protein (DUF373 family)